MVKSALLRICSCFQPGLIDLGHNIDCTADEKYTGLILLNNTLVWSGLILKGKIDLTIAKYYPRGILDSNSSRCYLKRWLTCELKLKEGINN